MVSKLIDLENLSPKNSLSRAISLDTCLRISLVALFLAMTPDSSVLGLVSYAWAGFGAAFALDTLKLTSLLDIES